MLIRFFGITASGHRLQELLDCVCSPSYYALETEKNLGGCVFARLLRVNTPPHDRLPVYDGASLSLHLRLAEFFLSDSHRASLPISGGKALIRRHRIRA